jgi:pyruvate kinase
MSITLTHPSTPKKSLHKTPGLAKTGVAHPKGAWDDKELKSLIEQLWFLRKSMLDFEAGLAPRLAHIDPSYQVSARNLAHYLALRQGDLRPLQEKLAWIGVSSLGRAESNVLANLDKVLGILLRLTEQPWQSHSREEPAGIVSSRNLLKLHTTELLGAQPAGRAVRIMVTLSSETAHDFGLVRQLVVAGMDIARINCAHDTPAQWKAMAAHVRRASKAVGRPVRILMDLGGPKLRTGHITPALSVLKLQPRRDDLGRVVESARIGLTPIGTTVPLMGASLQVGLPADFLSKLEVNDHLDLTDARGASRSLQIVRLEKDCVLAECMQTAYLTPGMVLKRRRKGGRSLTATLAELPPQAVFLRLERGNILRLTREGVDQPTPKLRGKKSPQALPCVTCTPPEVFEQVCVGERIWFDDGRIGGVIRRAERDWLEVEITHARDGGEKLTGDKGINFPDSQIELPALTQKDMEDLQTISKVADMVGLSFVQRARDVELLRVHLSELGASNLGIVLKIETRRSFEHLPELLYSAMVSKAVGVMIARGDLAVECGYERLAEVQEEILWLAEAAHMPVIWATQVLETLAKTGLPSRAEVTDAAMAERAECVMLNKGPYLLDAMRTLEDILRRMQTHQAKKRTLLRALCSWPFPEVERSSSASQPRVEK